MLLLSVPAALVSVCALLVLAASLEQRRVRVLVRMAVRSKSSPEVAERVIAAELAPILAARGFSR